MIYVLKCCSSVYDRDIDVMYSDDYEKLDTFIEFVATYFQYPESYLYSFNEFLTQIKNCKTEWVDDFDKMYSVLNTMVSAALISLPPRKKEWINLMSISQNSWKCFKPYQV